MWVCCPGQQKTNVTQESAPVRYAVTRTRQLGRAVGFTLRGMAPGRTVHLFKFL
jgi:hypothetical protein